MRRYSDPVEVRSSEPEVTADPSAAAASPAAGPVPGPPGAAPLRSPEAFIWRGRLYVVRRVLAHWCERRAWWRDALDPVPGQSTGIGVASREQHVWRVEASRGQAYGIGVFDLTSDGAEYAAGAEYSGGAPSATGAAATWRLVRVAD